MDFYLRLPQLSILTGIKRHTLNARIKTLIPADAIARSNSNQIILSPEQVRVVVGSSFTNLGSKIVYIGNLKGGVGKTTLAYLIANACASLGLKTCGIDLDVQANFTSQFKHVSPDHPVFYDLVNKSAHLNDAIINLAPTLDIIPSSLRNGLIEKALTVQPPKHQLNWLKELCINKLRNKYDVIIVDTPPHLSTLNSVFSLCLGANDNILIPVCAEEFSSMGVSMFLDDIASIRESYEVTDDVNISIVMNKFFQNQKTNLDMLVKMGNKYEGMLSDSIIRDSAKIRDIINNKTPFSEFLRSKEIYENIRSLLTDTQILKESA